MRQVDSFFRWRLPGGPVGLGGPRTGGSISFRAISSAIRCRILLYHMVSPYKALTLSDSRMEKGTESTRRG